ncbi:TIGR02757 family protein [Dysgonomonas sp. 520]|uniref:TIGR02757 family protein n=1 Tax=Dysgonomonas sp. 520 TaxID=2302931 RepID=UPI0013CF9B7A|nr:TIGR02757 family protein [Dysgonomonas sp. 520]NDW11133.1 TIGR02757 family protein [Dysgonomonas sp. 520]
MNKKILDLKTLLDRKVEQYNNQGFIINDPISIPHRFEKKQDIEIMAFFASIFAWGQRATIINKCIELSERMDNSPYQFIMEHNEEDLKSLLGFKHRTFNDLDLLYFVEFFKYHYQKNDSLESAFFPKKGMSVEDGLNHFRSYFMSLPSFVKRTGKHVSSPNKKSACKRLNMFLRWMVRKDKKGVDFGLWNMVSPKDLICPLDLHVERTARMLGLLTRDKNDWKAAIELTQNLCLLDQDDPVKYDFALFGISIEEKCIIDRSFN